MSTSADQPDKSPANTAVKEGRVPWHVQPPEPIRPEDTADIRFIKRCAFWKYWIDCLLVRKAMRWVLYGFFVAVLAGFLGSPAVTLASLCIFTMLGLAFALSSILEIMPFTRFSLRGLFLAVFTVQIPCAMMFSSNSPQIFSLGTLLAMVWFYIVGSRLHFGIIAAREEKPRKAQRLKEEAEIKPGA